ncbi:hypothetical protein H4Q32_025549 [Labeo rohita]|uniref:Uncharacterized protein n=1 Tax=Labeo rohita TaxID=84645 RepID=A0ABQ8LAF6_LABRO|nr:hypothetical protein H4Q32_025549 [Labeo rohita]
MEEIALWGTQTSAPPPLGKCDFAAAAQKKEQFPQSLGLSPRDQLDAPLPRLSHLPPPGCPTMGRSAIVPLIPLALRLEAGPSPSRLRDPTASQIPSEVPGAYGSHSHSDTALFATYKTASALAIRSDPEEEHGTVARSGSVLTRSVVTSSVLGVPLGQVSRHVVVSTDASKTGWGAICNRQAALGSWTGPQLQWNISCLELLAVLLILRRFLPIPQAPHESSSLVDSPEEGYSFSGDGHNLAPMSRSGEPPHVASGQDKVDLTGLPQGVINTITQARAPSTRQAYALKWSLFIDWCSSH